MEHEPGFVVMRVRGHLPPGWAIYPGTAEMVTILPTRELAADLARLLFLDPETCAVLILPESN